MTTHTPLERVRADELAEDLATRAHRTLSPYGYPGDSMAADLQHALDVVDRLAAEVERMRAGMLRLADTMEAEAACDADFGLHIRCGVKRGCTVRLRSLLTPTPEAPDGQ